MSNENSQKFKIGCHLSASKGFLNMGKEIVALGGNTFQFFTRNPRGGAAKDIDEKDVEAFKKFADENGIEVILAHAPYTLNACSADESIRDLQSVHLRMIWQEWSMYREIFIIFIREAM